MAFSTKYSSSNNIPAAVSGASPSSKTPSASVTSSPSLMTRATSLLSQYKHGGWRHHRNIRNHPQQQDQDRKPMSTGTGSPAPTYRLFGRPALLHSPTSSGNSGLNSPSVMRRNVDNPSSPTSPPPALSSRRHLFARQTSLDARLPCPDQQQHTPVESPSSVDHLHPSSKTSLKRQDPIVPVSRIATPAIGDASAASHFSSSAPSDPSQTQQQPATTTAGSARRFRIWDRADIDDAVDSAIGDRLAKFVTDDQLDRVVMELESKFDNRIRILEQKLTSVSMVCSQLQLEVVSRQYM